MRVSLTDQHGRMLILTPTASLARGIAEPEHEVSGHGARAHRAAHAVGAEIIPAHALWYASQTAITSRVSRTSARRSILAPLCSASKAIARLPASPLVDLPAGQLAQGRICGTSRQGSCSSESLAQMTSGGPGFVKRGLRRSRSRGRRRCGRLQMPAPFALSTDSFNKGFHLAQDVIVIAGRAASSPARLSCA